MKLQRTTLVLLVLAILLGGFVYFYEFQWRSQQEQVKKKKQQLFSFKEDDVKALKITTPSETINLERSPEAGKTKWLMKSPDNVPANDGTVAYLLNLLETESTEQSVNTPPSELAQFGLKQPQATIDITLNNQKTHKLVLGKPSFDNRFLYAQNNFATTPDGNFEVVSVSKKFDNAIKRSLSEWKAVENNPSPSPSPGATPTNSTPSPGATPAIPTIKPIPINQSPKAVPNNSGTNSNPSPNPNPTTSPSPKVTPTPTPTPKTPTPTPTLNPASDPTK
ncbi:MAG: DUF4340 domain-containing protein [Cyanobacteriota bacterium]|nr:DUF4340 domain-containing protein [Cyanobacteriota bacterium]